MLFRKVVLGIPIIFASCLQGFSQQHQPAQDSMPAMNMQNHDTVPARHDMSTMSGHDMSNMSGSDMLTMQMSHAYSRNLPMNRDGSGTSWLPDAAPMYAYMFHANTWSFMLHGNVAIRYTHQDFTKNGRRGGDKFDAPNWLMLMGQHQVGQRGLFHFNIMMSADPLTEGGDGYPLLFQTGESWKGRPLVDRQHPHDLFSELSVSYSYAVSKNTDIYVYAGYPGEPALGSVAFMHRPSALANPDAPISHHWNDGTHIRFGVATLGVRIGKIKLEGSSFTGREPNENRYNFDKLRLDSWSGRLSFNPSDHLSVQASHGFIKSPELLHTQENVHRTTASLFYSLPFGKQSWFNATALWGMNKMKGHDGEHAVLIEGSYRHSKIEFYTRYEFTQKSNEELNLDPAFYGGEYLHPVNALTLGMNYDLLQVGQTRFALGGQFLFFKSNRQLESLYGKSPVGAEVFLRIYPGLMKM